MSVDYTNRQPEHSQQQPVAKAQAIRYHRRIGSFTLRELGLLFYGKTRRFYITKFRKAYIVQQEALRKGGCHRCGACCKLLFKCPFLLEEENGFFACRIHGNKPENCHIFPIDKTDLRDRDVVSPLQK